MGLARARPNDLRIRRRHRERADRVIGLAVEDRLSVLTAIHGLPNAAGGGTGVIRQWIAGHAGHGRDPIADGSDVPVFQFLVVVGGDVLSCARRCERSREEKNSFGCRSYIYNGVNNLQAHYRWYVTDCF